MPIINYQLSINIKNPAIEKRRTRILPLHALASLATFLLIPSIIIIVDNYILPIIIYTTIAILFFIIPFIEHKKNKLWKWNSILRCIESFLFGITGIVFLIYAQWLNGINGIIWFVVFMLLSKAEQCAFQPQQIIIHTSGIAYTHILHFISISWNNIEKIVVRPDFFSIFKKNNRYLQFEIIDELSDAQLKDINDLCQKLIIDNA